MEHWQNLSLEDLPGEVWKSIVGYEGIYEVSNLERVKSLERSIKRIPHQKIHGHSGKLMNCKESFMSTPVQVLKQYSYESGYRYVSLSNTQNRKKHKLHRLMAIHFIPNPKNKCCVNHINGVPTDNRIENLEWCTYAENNRHATATGLNVPKKGEASHRSVKVIQYSLNGKYIKEWGCINDAAKALTIDGGTISKCCKRNKNYTQSYGFVWRYKEEMEYLGKNSDLPPNSICIKSKPKFKKRRETTIKNKTL